MPSCPAPVYGQVDSGGSKSSGSHGSLPAAAHPIGTPRRVYLMADARIPETSTGRPALTARLATDLRAQRPEVIAELLDAFGRELAGVAFLIVRNHADAEEIVMDTLITAWWRANDLRDDGALRTWLLRIATRHALSRRRRRQHVTTALHLAVPLPAAPTDEPSVDRLLIAEALSDLPPKMRAAIALHHCAGLSVPEVAGVLGTSQNTIKSNLRDAMARLRAAFDVPGKGATNPGRRNDA